MPCRETVEHGKHGAKVGHFVCPVCSSDFVRYESEVRSYPPTCSRACKVQFRPTKTKQRYAVDCVGCGKPFDVIRTRSEGPRKARYCTSACKAASLVGANNPQWRGGISERKSSTRKIIASRIKAEGACQKCAATEGLHGHHVLNHADHPDLRDEPSNILVLCGPCHALEHPELASMLVRPAIRSGVTLDCPACGKGFYVKRSHASHRRYCSPPCAYVNRPKRSLAA